MQVTSLFLESFYFKRPANCGIIGRSRSALTQRRVDIKCSCVMDISATLRKRKRLCFGKFPGLVLRLLGPSCGIL